MSEHYAALSSGGVSSTQTGTKMEPITLSKNGLPTAPVVEPRISFAEIGRKGDAIYARLRPELEKEHYGKYLLIDVETGEYAYDSEREKAYNALLTKCPNALVYCARIGWRTTLRP